MLGMGMTLSIDDLKGALSMPREVAAGVFLQYTIMPLTGATVARVLGLPSHYAAGLVLVSCCPGGTASNVVTYLARGNVALSVIMTAISTFLAVVMTPLLTAKLAGQYVAVDANALVLSTLQVVLLPVLTGAGMAHYLPGLVRILSPLAPTVAVVTIAAVCAGAIAQSAAAITTTGAQIFVAVAMLHASGFLLGYLAAKVIRFSESTARTISIEVGMQNSVLGVVLANQHFTSPLTAVPCAISSVCHSVFGSALAGFWQASSQGPSES
uniref:Sodium bile family protein n=2 Tax=Selaginella moellendorffii TaxID=88036 RepID=C1JYZ4_SELML|nr:sodium bile family protein [Selaginella moellendorffii]